MFNAEKRKQRLLIFGSVGLALVGAIVLVGTREKKVVVAHLPTLKKSVGTDLRTVQRPSQASPERAIDLMEEAPSILSRELPKQDLSVSYQPQGGGSGEGSGAASCMAVGAGMPCMAPPPPSAPAPLQGRNNPNFHTEAYDHFKDNAFQDATREPLSTFGVDVDTASYANARRFIMDGQLPPKGAVRLEELVNYFEMPYAQPVNGHPIAIHTELASCPWAATHHLLKIGIQGKSYTVENLPERNLVFLVDVSGSMQDPNKLPLVKRGLGYLVDQLRSNDHVAMVVYAGASGLVLKPTAGDKKRRIQGALDDLEAGGSTNGAGGIQLAYETARKHFKKGAINRVILCTDGDFNVGTTSQDELVSLIEKERQSGVFLSVLGFGCGNYKDSTLEKLADKGDGHYAYIDSELEARKVFGEGGGTLATIAKDVKVQVEFNPAKVAYYRLLGYENRMLEAHEFNDDTKDAGDMGSGHRVTALYEVVPPGVPFKAPKTDALKYQKVEKSSAAQGQDLATVKFRYKEPDALKSQLLEQVVPCVLNQPSSHFRFSAAVAAFGMILRQSPNSGKADYKLVQSLAQDGLSFDPKGERSEFLSLVKKAEALGKNEK